MEMQDFLRYFPPMAALSVASFAGAHLLRDSVALSQNPQLANGNASQSPRTPAATAPNADPRALSPTHPANLTTMPEGSKTQIAAPEVVPPEGAMVDVEALLLASNEPYPIPELPLPPSLSESFAQTRIPAPAQVSLDPALLQSSVQALSDTPLETMMAAQVASARGANPGVVSVPEEHIPALEGNTAHLEPVAAVTNPAIAPPETLAPSRRDTPPIQEPRLPTLYGSTNSHTASLPDSQPVAAATLATEPTPGANLDSPGILVAALPSPGTGSALQLAPLQAAALGDSLPEDASTASQSGVSMSGVSMSGVPMATDPNAPLERQRDRPLETAVNIPVPPPDPASIASPAPLLAEDTVSTSPSQLPPPDFSHPTGVMAQSLPPSHALDYTLGPGDRLFVDIFNVPEYSKSYQVMVDGTLSLPRIGRIAVAGLTLDQASALISDRYGQFFVEPLTTVVLEQARPVTVALSGEVNRPGSYQFNTTETGAFPTLSQAIRQAEGITQTADLRQVEIRRPQANGLEQVIEVNLWDLLQSSNLAQDITLRDGDMIRIAPAPALSPTQRSQLAEANFAPATIRVNVIGEVVRPGVVEITPNTPLNQAVLNAGGFVNGRANRQAVELIRLQPNGTVQRRTIAVDLAEGVNEATNPILQPNDVVLVARSNFARTTDSISQVTAPTLFLLNLLRLF